MSTKMGASYRNLFVDIIEHQFFSQYNGPKPKICGRHIDDCMGAASSIREELAKFTPFLVHLRKIYNHLRQQLKL